MRRNRMDTECVLSVVSQQRPLVNDIHSSDHSRGGTDTYLKLHLEKEHGLGTVRQTDTPSLLSAAVADG